MGTNERIFALRSIMASLGYEAYIVSSNDQHLSEYVADHWKFREWLSGFSGSAGTLVVLEDDAGLWTDSRYFIQAEMQLKDSGIKLFRIGEPETPSIEDWLNSLLEPGNTVGIDGRTFSVEEVRNFTRELKKKEIKLDIRQVIVDDVWTTRPAIPENTIKEHPVEYAGYSREEKLDMVRELMRQKGASYYLVEALDEIAWVLNLRGDDVSYNPVFHSFLVIGLNNVNLFIDPHKITSQIGKQLALEDIKVSLYDDFYGFLKDFPSRSGSIFFDPRRTNGMSMSMLPQALMKVEGSSFITTLKATKNPVEIKGIDNAMIKDGVALVQFYHWLESTLGKEEITEISIAKKLKSFRSMQKGFKSESFYTIAGYNANGAIVHYAATDESSAVIEPAGLLLLDSGAQYIDGTTDITRTFRLGEISEQACIDYTMVLKGHIALAQAVFPSGTRGVHLDILARQFLWQHGLNYGHGTGHGVGCYLNVHEAPQSIRPQDNGIAIEEGMITSNEPGIYRKGEYGIRIENLILTEKDETTQFGDFYRFRTLTLCPIDLSPLKKEYLTSFEIKWINDYHKKVYDLLNPFLDNDVKEFLAAKCRKI